MELFIYEFILNFPLKSQIPHLCLQMCPVENVTKFMIDLQFTMAAIFLFDKFQERVCTQRLTFIHLNYRPGLSKAVNFNFLNLILNSESETIDKLGYYLFILVTMHFRSCDYTLER